MTVAPDTVFVLVCALVWWIPAFMALSDLQRRDGLPRPVVWKWTAVLCIPVLGPPLYYWRGRPERPGKRS